MIDTCIKCGACCEVLNPNCTLYDKDTTSCHQYENRPIECRQIYSVGDEFTKDTCEIMRCLRDLKGKIDRVRHANIVDLLLCTMFGASHKQLKILLSQVKIEDFA